MTLNRKWKDRLFIRIFSDPEDLLDLYNAINGTEYHDPEQLEITTLEDVIYMGMKNDASFIIDDELQLWEHQSTCNCNMPVRGLIYLASLYQQYIKRHRFRCICQKKERWGQSTVPGGKGGGA
ncbi:MAG: hypothetical protein Q4C73_02300 [Eubacteriales bacterium]|nr:hypothetical protein [Eubacteriales bacterium]